MASAIGPARSFTRVDHKPDELHRDRFGQGGPPALPEPHGTREDNNMVNNSDHTTTPATALLQFSRELRRVKREAGEPSLRELHRRSEGVLTIATTSRVLNGRTAASWFFTEAFLSACEIDRDTIIKVWRPKWVQMADVLDPLDGQPASSTDHQPTSTAPGTTCLRCGLLVGDPDRHQRWHDDQAEPTRVRPLRAVSDGEANRTWMRRRKAS
jgi:hypothetical protein